MPSRSDPPKLTGLGRAQNKIGRGHLAERQGVLSVSLKVALRSILLLALQEGDSCLCGKVVGLELLQSEVSNLQTQPRP